MNLNNNEKTKTKQIPTSYNILCASTAACFAEICTIPMDTIKVRLMLQGEERKKALMQGKIYETKYKSMTNCGFTIFKEEGIISLFKGLSAGLQRQTIFAGLRIGLYPIVRDKLTSEKDPLKIPLLIRISAALITGVFAIICASPTDVVKIRLQADGRRLLEDRRYKGSIDAYGKIISSNGYTGLYQGLGINILRNGSINATELATYDTVKSYLVTNFNINPNTKLLHLICGSIGGFVAVTLFSSFDVVKTRLMNDTNKIYLGIVDCFKKSYSNEGIRVFYSGYLPNLTRVILWNSCCFVFLERCQLFVRTNLL